MPLACAEKISIPCQLSCLSGCDWLISCSICYGLLCCSTYIPQYLQRLLPSVIMSADTAELLTRIHFEMTSGGIVVKYRPKCHFLLCFICIAPCLTLPIRLLQPGRDRLSSWQLQSLVPSVASQALLSSSSNRRF